MFRNGFVDFEDPVVRSTGGPSLFALHERSLH
jgi:hypothetical protein